MLDFTSVRAKLHRVSVCKPHTLHDISVTNNDTMLGLSKCLAVPTT
jgi:hypothetical protein